MAPFAYPVFVIITIPIVLAIAAWRWFFYKNTRYLFSCTKLFNETQNQAYYYSLILFCLRLVMLIALVFALGRPRSPDLRTKIPVQGIDIMLVMDVSESMAVFDDLDDRRTRMEIARTEALKFIQKRAHDPIGMVLFANGTVSRCPLTLDKNMLSKLLQETDIGIIDPSQTLLSTGIITAANRLKASKSKTKIMIVLTDGEPSGNDIDPHIALDLAKKLGIKIYTIGIIGSPQGGFFNYLGRVVRIQNKINTDLLKNIAESSGGQFFDAHTASDMEKIYNAIDKLERSDHDLGYAHYIDYFSYFLMLACICLCIEIILKTLWISL